MDKLRRHAIVTLALAAVGWSCDAGDRQIVILPMTPGQLSLPTVGLDPVLAACAARASQLAARSSDGTGQLFTFRFGKEDRLEAVTWDKHGDGSEFERWRYKYDYDGVLDRLGHDRTGKGYMNEVWRFTFLPEGPLSMISWESANEARLWFYGFTADGRLDRIRFSRDMWNYSYLTDGRLASIAHGDDLWLYDYAADGELQGIDRGDEHWRYFHDADGTLGLVTKDSESWSYEYDERGRPAVIRHVQGRHTIVWSLTYEDGEPS